MAADILAVRNLQVGLASGAETTPLIKGINFSIKPNETLALIGESGCGKTMTALSIMQLLPPAIEVQPGSQIFLGDKNLLALSEVKMRTIRGRRVGMIFQEPSTSLNPVLTIGEQLSEVVDCHLHLMKVAKQQRILELLTAVGIHHATQCYKQYPHQLSGGMQQRVMIAMALIAGPDLLIADEPTSSLDAMIQFQVLNLLRELQQKTNMAMLLITHDLGVAKLVADQVVVMREGQIVEQANTAQFFSSSAKHHPYTQQLFAALPSFAKRGRPLLATDAEKISPASNINLQNSIVENQATNVQTENQPTLLTVQNLKIYFPIHKGIFKRTLVKLSEKEILSPLQAEPFGEPPFLQEELFGEPQEELSGESPPLQGEGQGRDGVSNTYIKAVDGISLTIPQGRTVALIGESGCGKTTIGKGILQLLPVTAGTVTFQGKDLLHSHGQALREIRHGIQMIFQDPYSSLNPRMLVEDIIAEGIDALALAPSKAHRAARISELLQQVGLSPDSQSRYPHEFSGGQRQRIAIARALAVNPKLIICDEPTSALDVHVQAQILDLLRQLQQTLGIAYLFITHNIAVVAYLADEIIVMYQGKIIERGLTAEVLQAPKEAYTKDLLRVIADV